MALFIRKNEVKLGLLILTSNISKSCGDTKTINIAFKCPSSCLLDFRRTGL